MARTARFTRTTRAIIAVAVAALLAAWTNADIRAFHCDAEGYVAHLDTPRVQGPAQSPTPDAHEHGAHGNCALAASASVSPAATSAVGMLAKSETLLTVHVDVSRARTPGRTASGLAPPA